MMGGSIGYSDMISKLLRAGYKLDTEKAWRWPFCFIFGRSDGSVSVDGANVYPGVIEKVLQNDLIFNNMSSFRLFVSQEATGGDRFMIYVQVEEKFLIGISGNEKTKIEKRLSETILGSLILENMDYAKRYSDRPQAVKPWVELVKEGEGIFADEKNKIKHRYTSTDIHI